jgi:hypothetical protein
MVWWPFATMPETADTLEVTGLHKSAPLLYSTRNYEIRRYSLLLDIMMPVVNASKDAGALFISFHVNP